MTKHQIDHSSKSLQLAMPGESSYATVTKLLGDMRCNVELAVPTGTGPTIRCKIWGFAKGKSRRIKEGDTVLIAWRLCDSNRSTADILQKYSNEEADKLHCQGHWPCAFDWVRSDEQASPAQQQPQEYKCSRDMPSDSSDDDASTDEEGCDEATWCKVHMPASSLAFAKDLPSPTFKARKCKASKAPSSFRIDLNLHDRYQRPLPPSAVTVQARVTFWSAAKGTGYANPLEPNQPDVRLTEEALLKSGLQRLDAGDTISVVFDSKHQRPFSLEISPLAPPQQPHIVCPHPAPLPTAPDVLQQPRCAVPTRPSPAIVTLRVIRAQVKWWCRDKGLGYATTDALAKGVEVRLTAAAVTAANLSKPLWKGDAIIVTIDPRHERPYALDLKRAN